MDAAGDTEPRLGTRGLFWPRSGLETDSTHRRVLFLSLNWTRPKDPRTPLGVAYLYSWLKGRGLIGSGLKVGFADYTVSDDLDEVTREVTEAKPDILGIGVYVWNNIAVRHVLSLIRGAGYTGLVVLGGPEISYAECPLSDEFPEADVFVKGEGEAAFEEVVRSLLESRSPVGPGILLRDSRPSDSQAHLPRGQEPPQPQSMAELVPLLVRDGFSRIQFQRGCIYACTFCAFPFKDRVFRNLESATIRQDLRNISSAGLRSLAVLDPIFFQDRSRALRILEIIDEELPGVRIEIQSRLEHLDALLIAQLSRMDIILECGVQTLDRNVQRAIKRGGDLGIIQDNLRRLSDARVKFEVHLIFGLPFQSTESLCIDARFLLGYRPYRLRLFPLLDHRGTELSKECRTKYHHSMTFSEAFPREVLSTEWMPEAQVAQLKQIHVELEERLWPKPQEFWTMLPGFSRIESELSLDQSLNLTVERSVSASLLLNEREVGISPGGAGAPSAERMVGGRG